jgi:hypothetical protein
MNYVTFDPENGDLNLNLPSELKAFHDEVCLELSEHFMGSLDETVLTQMNQYVEAWITIRKKK